MFETIMRSNRTRVHRLFACKKNDGFVNDHIKRNVTSSVACIHLVNGVNVDFIFVKNIVQWDLLNLDRKHNAVFYYFLESMEAK